MIIRKKLAIVVAVTVTASCLPVLAGSARDVPGDHEASAVRNGSDPRGFIYGTVVTEEGKRYTGTLRWGTEEAFWDDLFNGSKSKLPYIDRLPEGKRKKNRIRIFGFTIGYEWSDSNTSRQFVARFGDIKEIRPRGSDRADLTMRDGTTYRIDGGSNDVGAEIHVQDPSLGAVTVKWDNIDRIIFEATPATLRPEASRLYGDVTTTEGAFHGFIQWDSEECLSTDKLDGDSDGERLSLDMGRIRSIERKSSKASSVEMKDGRKLVLSGTNDVNSSIRGIFVVDERFGRVKVSWDVFKKVTFQDPPGTGPGYADYKSGGFLQGTAVDEDGKTNRGRIVFDLDETQSWEMLDGEKDGVEYSIPFEMVRSIQPMGTDGSKVKLKNGTEITLEESQDVGEMNAGLVILSSSADDKGQYLPWDHVRRIDFE